MPETFTKNLEALSKRYPHLAAKLRAFTPTDRFHLEALPSGAKTIVVSTKGGKQSISGPGDPQDAAREYWKHRKLKNPVNMIFLGLDDGYRLFTYLDAPNPLSFNYFLVERDLELFYWFLHIWDASKPLLQTNIHWFVDEAEAELFVRLHDVLDDGMQYTSIVATGVEGASYSYENNIRYYKKFLSTLHDATVDLLRTAGNSPHDSFVGVMNMLRNLHTIAHEPGMNQLFGRFLGKPAVIVAAGPSLDKNVELLKEIQDRAVILSVDASLKHLLGKGIRPHFVTVIERVRFSPRFFAGISPEECRDTVQVAVPVVEPEVYGVYPGPKALLYRPYSHFQWLNNEKGTLMTGASCANMAFKIAEALGCDPIVLVGQDLAYGEDGATHSEAAPWGRKLEGILISDEPVLRVRGNIDEWVLTNTTWNNFRLSYIKDVASFHGTVINATEGGAHIDGTRVVSLRRAIDEHMKDEFPVADRIREGLASSSRKSARDYLGWVHEKRIPETLRAVDRAVARAGRLDKEIAKALTRCSDERASNRLVRKSFDFTHQMIRDPLLFESVFHIVQPAVVQMMLEHFDLPNRFPDRGEAVRRQLKLQGTYIGDIQEMLKRIRSLFADVRESAARDQFVANLAFLEPGYPNLARTLKDLQPTGRVKRVWAEQRGWELITHEGPGADGARPEPAAPTGEHALDVFLGVGLAPDFLARLRRTTPRSRGCVLVEKDLEVFREFLHVVDLETLRTDQALWLVVGDIERSVLAHGEAIPTWPIFTSGSDMAALRTSPGYAADPRYYDHVLERLAGEFATWRGVFPDPQVWPTCLRRMLENAQQMVSFRCVDAARPHLGGLPALVLLPGFPLGEAARLLEAAARRVLVIAYGEAAQALQDAGPPPHLAVPTFDWAPDHPGAGSFSTESILLCSGMVHPDLPRRHNGPIAVAPSPDLYPQWLFGRDIQGMPLHFPGGESMALSMPAWLGCGDTAVLGGGRYETGAGRGPFPDPRHLDPWQRLLFDCASKKLDAKHLRDAGELETWLGSCEATNRLTNAMDALSRPTPPEIARAARKRLRESELPKLAESVREKMRVVQRLKDETAKGDADLHPERCPFNKLYWEPGTATWLTTMVASCSWSEYQVGWADLSAETKAGPPPAGEAQRLYATLLDTTEGLLNEVANTCAEMSVAEA